MKVIAPNKRLIIAGAGVIVALILVWLATTDHVAIWPIRNTLQYRALTWWWEQVGYPAVEESGTLQGTVRNQQGEPVAGAWVLISGWDGTSYSARSDASGRYRISAIPAGTYQPVASAPEYGNVQFGNFWDEVEINAGQPTSADAVLPPEPSHQITPGRNLVLGEKTSLSCTDPIESSAVRQQVTFDSDGQPNQPTFYYVPVTTTTTSRLPILLTDYPGPADSWECVSLPLAAAGYAVLAAGPAYSFDLERDIDELQRLLTFADEGKFPGGDGARVALLGGSYSALHVQRLLERDLDIQAAVLLGPPTDLFDMRRRLENGTFIPPFGLDQAFIALGLPSEEPLRYWRYSGAYQIEPDFPPLLIIHSRADEIVPYQQSELLAQNLAAAHVPYEIHFFEGTEHYLLADEGDALEMYQITLDFLAEQFK